MTQVVSAPGRANLIGEYTDVNQGFVLPVALDLRTTISGRPSDRLALTSADLPGDGVVEVDLTTGAGPTAGWGRYAAAVVASLLQEGLLLKGFEGVVSSQVPLGAGLSSSAALETAIALAVLAEPLEDVLLARLCQRAENEGVGVQSGIMDQLASICAREGQALFLDCRDLSSEHVPVPEGLTVLVVDSAVSRSLSSSAYNERAEQCATAARELGVRSLRDVTLEQLEASSLSGLPRQRAQHVVTENARVLASVAALRADDRTALGNLFAASHASLAVDFGVSIPELDQLVACAAATPGVHASRLTGAGFGGCTVSLVDTDGAEQIRDEVLARYAVVSGRTPRGWLSRPAGGARRSA